MDSTALSTVLLLGAKSADKPLDSVPKELSTIKEVFNNNKSKSLPFEIEYEPYFTLDLLKKHLDKLAGKVAILHFAGHSDKAGLQTDDGLVYSQHIAEILKDWSIQPTLIF